MKIRIIRTIILPVILCGCEIWFLTVREGHTSRLRVSENRVLSKILESYVYWTVHHLDS